MDQELRRIIALVQAKRYDEARQPLNAYLKEHPNTAYAWYMQSFVATTSAEKSRAIQHALKLAPENKNIVQRAAKLGEAQSGLSGSKRWLVTLGIFLLLGVVAVGVILLQSRPQTIDSVPTLAALGFTESALQVLAQTPIPSEIVIADPTIQATVPTSTSTLIPIIETAAPSLTLTPTPNTAPPTTFVAAGPTQALTLPVFDTLAPEVTIDSQIILTRQAGLPTAPPNVPTNTPIASPTRPTSTPFTPIPSPTVVISGSVPFGTEGNIGVGQVRIIQASRPGLAAIQQIGGTVPNAPAGNDWVLVEISMQCIVTDNCAASLGVPRLSASSGTIYDIPSGINLEPFFNSDAYFSGQVWGFAAFLVPSKESKLSLLLTQNGQSFAFALQ